MDANSERTEELKRDCLLFDLDGTLIDSAPDIAASLNRQLARLGRAPLRLERVKDLVGDGYRRLLERAVAATGETLPEEEFAALLEEGLRDYFAAASVETRLFAGVRETLIRLKAEGYRLAVCTNKQEALSRAILEDLEVAALFDGVGGGDSYAVRKPDPGHVLALLAELERAPEQAVMIGDSRNDLRAGRNAGLPVILVTFGYCPEGAATLAPDALAESFDQLPELLARLS